MRVKLNKAVKMFFGNSSLEMVYFEAVANALDAGANAINIIISAQDYSQPETLTITIEDNGIGFTDDRFRKFSNLFDVDDSTHKGLGRLVYLCYFENIIIHSNYDGFYNRKIEFSDAFDGKCEIYRSSDENTSGTKIQMSNYILTRLAQHSFIQPNYIKDRILEKFYSRLYKLKQSEVQVEISISATINKISAIAKLTTEDIPNFTQIKVSHSLDFFSNVELYYHIEGTPMEISSVITAISIDDRTYPIDIIAPENLPIGYKMVFLLFSDYFDGKVDATREAISISELEQVKRIFRDNITKIIDEKIPQIAKQNQEKKQRLINQFPHLNGYFEVENIGYASQEDLLKKAQDRFFREQREILRATHLTDEQFKKSMELSSRELTAYITFRQIIINRLKDINKTQKEAEIHNLIIPMKEKFDGENLKNDLYRNNIWVIDDKYMTYDTVLSDKEMSEVIKVITEDENVDKDDDRPDISIIFSGNPTDDIKKVDVVIVELKRKGLIEERNVDVETQLEKRARKLLRFYNNKIQQIWFYGIVEFDDDYELHLQSNGYHKLYSKGKVYVRNKDIPLTLNSSEKLPMNLCIMDFDALVFDADARNSTFLNVIKSKF